MDLTKVNYKATTLVVIIFLIFYSVYVFFLFKNRPESAYSSLLREEESTKVKLQDNRVHNWEELNKKK